MVISFAETEFALSLEVPRANIVGFGHAAENEDERAAVAVAISELSEPLGLFEVSPEAGCMTASANVAIVGDAFGQDENQVGAAAMDQTKFHADYLVQCQDIVSVSSIRFAYFDRFAKAQRLEVELISAAGTQNYTMERAAPVLTLPN